MTWYEYEKQLERLAFINEADDYEVDQTGIFYDAAANNFVVLTATGCSCWDGDCEEDRYPTLDAVDEGLRTRENYGYNPSMKGIDALMREARGCWGVR